MTRLADEAAALHIFGDGQPLSFAEIRGHIASCPQCAGADPLHVHWILGDWQRGIAATARRARR